LVALELGAILVAQSAEARDLHRVIEAHHLHGIDLGVHSSKSGKGARWTSESVCQTPYGAYSATGSSTGPRGRRRLGSHRSERSTASPMTTMSRSLPSPPPRRSPRKSVSSPTS